MSVVVDEKHNSLTKVTTHSTYNEKNKILIDSFINTNTHYSPKHFKGGCLILLLPN